MPSSLKDAQELANNLGIQLDGIPIQPSLDDYLNLLHPFFQEGKEDVTEENLQARIRGIILMALSNKLGHVVLGTGNKSELAMGYCTLYGDVGRWGVR